MENILINIDSRFRNKNVYPNAGKFTYKLKEKIKNIIYIRVSSVEIPNLYFTISEAKKNNKFVISIDCVDFTVELEDGFYNSAQIITSIQSQIENIPGQMEINLNMANGYVSIMSVANFSIDFTNSGPYPSLGYILGFRKNTYNSVVIGEKKYVNSESQLDVIGDNYVFLKVNDFGKIYNFNQTNNNEGEELIYSYLAKVILNTPKGDKVFDNNNFITKKFIFRQPTNIEKIDVELIDPLGFIIDMVYMDFSFTLEIGCIYDGNLYQKYLTSYPVMDGISYNKELIPNNMDKIIEILPNPPEIKPLVEDKKPKKSRKNRKKIDFQY
jgi:hypothetical protein